MAWFHKKLILMLGQLVKFCFRCHRIFGDQQNPMKLKCPFCLETKTFLNVSFWNPGYKPALSQENSTEVLSKILGPSQLILVTCIEKYFDSQSVYNKYMCINITLKLNHMLTQLCIFLFQLDCCGSRGPQDFRYSYWYNQSLDQVSQLLCYTYVMLHLWKWRKWAFLANTLILVPLEMALMSISKHSQISVPFENGLNGHFWQIQRF